MLVTLDFRLVEKTTLSVVGFIGHLIETTKRTVVYVCQLIKEEVKWSKQLHMFARSVFDLVVEKDKQTLLRDGMSRHEERLSEIMSTWGVMYITASCMGD